MTVSALQYHLLWVTLALAATALASAVLARRWRSREARRQAAEDALQWLARYSEWLAAQRRASSFDGDRGIHRTALGPLQHALQAGFPQLGGHLHQLLDVHARTTDFLWRQQVLRTADPEAWLESEHDGRFMALWGEHQACVHALAECLRATAGEPLVDAEPESVYPA